MKLVRKALVLLMLIVYIRLYVGQFRMRPNALSRSADELREAVLQSGVKINSHVGNLTVIYPASLTFTLYPNPGSGQIQLRFGLAPQPQDIILIKNIFGQEILRQTANNSAINMTSFHEGIYLIEWLRNGVVLATTKFIRS